MARSKAKTTFMIADAGAERVRHHLFHPQDVQNAHLHRGEFRSSEFVLAALSSNFYDPTLTRRAARCVSNARSNHRVAQTARDIHDGGDREKEKVSALSHGTCCDSSIYLLIAPPSPVLGCPPEQEQGEKRGQTFFLPIFRLTKYE